MLPRGGTQEAVQSLWVAAAGRELIPDSPEQIVGIDDGGCEGRSSPVLPAGPSSLSCAEASKRHNTQVPNIDFWGRMTLVSYLAVSMRNN